MRMMRRGRWAATFAVASVLALSPGVPLPTAAADGVPTDTAVLFAAGDVHSCEGAGDLATADLLSSLLAETPGATVAMLGDAVSLRPTAANYLACYGPGWGRFLDITRPVVGNHDYSSTGATGYFDYFGAAAGERDKGWYSFDLGAWHVIALNGNCSKVGGCGSTSPQGTWLKADLAAHPNDCTLALWHQPLYSSSLSTAAVRPLFQQLYDAGADVVLNGHLHNYEMFQPQNALGAADDRGVRQFVVGTGGSSSHPFGTILPNSAVRIDDTLGVLRLELRPTGYDWQYLPVPGSTSTDSGSAECVTGAPNRLANQGFEVDANADGRPDSWTSTTKFSRDGGVSPQQGNFAGRHTAADPSATSYTVAQVVRGIVPGTTYDVSGWINVPATTDTFSFTYEVLWRDAAGATIGRSAVGSRTATNGGVWEQLSASPVAPAGASSAQVRMVVRGLSATVLVDNFSVRAR
jgi:hypothetical protein